MSAKAKVVISTEQDWQKFREAKLDLIVDPMVFRSADVFLRGRQGAGASLRGRNSEEIWWALSQNIGSLLSFFDAVVLSEKLPIIDYGITFDSTVGYDTPWICKTANEALGEEVLVDVHVQGDVSRDARNSAFEKMRTRPPVSPELEAGVYKELSAFDYEWEPYKPGPGAAQYELDIRQYHALPEEKQALCKFLYGGLVFTAFAEMSGAGHLLQPKRNELFHALALAVPHDHERELFQELNRRIKAAPNFQEIKAELVSWPSCLPYLLSQNPQSPLELLLEAFRLRKTGMAADYRQLRSLMIRNWTERGFIDPAHEKDVQRIVLAFQKEMELSRKLPVEAGVEAKIDVTGVGITPTVKLDVPVEPIWGWVLSNIPGRRYLKLLLRLSRAAYWYPHLDRHLRTLWTKA